MGKNLLHVDVGCGNVEMIRYFNQIGISISSTEKNENSCSHYIGNWATYNIWANTEMLIELGASLFTIKSHKQTEAHVLPKKLQSPNDFPQWVDFMIDAGRGDIFG